LGGANYSRSLGTNLQMYCSAESER